MSAEAAEGYLARNLGRIRRTPELEEQLDISRLEVMDAMIAEMAMARLAAIADFTPTELDFFERGEEEERVYLLSLLEDPGTD